MDIQAAIDALPSSGGIINIPLGYHPGAPLNLKSGVILQGSGKQGTVIPPIAARSQRMYGCGLRDVAINGALAPGSYGIDWRLMTDGDISAVHIYNVAYGLVMTGAAYYNVIQRLTVDATDTAVELSGGANQNTFIGGKWSAPKGVVIMGCNGTTILGASLEAPINNMVFKQISGDDGSTCARGVRMEDSNHSSTYWNSAH